MIIINLSWRLPFFVRLFFFLSFCIRRFYYYFYMIIIIYDFFNYFFFIFYFYLSPSPLTTWRIFWPTMNITFALNICTNFFNFCKKNKNKKRQYITNVPVLEDKRVSSIFLIEFALLVRFFLPPFFFLLTFRSRSRLIEKQYNHSCKHLAFSTLV